jgi:hypothetical protein
MKLPDVEQGQKQDDDKRDMTLPGVERGPEDDEEEGE